MAKSTSKKTTEVAGENADLQDKALVEGTSEDDASAENAELQDQTQGEGTSEDEEVAEISAFELCEEEFSDDEFELVSRRLHNLDVFKVHGEAAAYVKVIGTGGLYFGNDYTVPYTEENVVFQGATLKVNADGFITTCSGTEVLIAFRK